MAFINFGMANTLAEAKASENRNKLFFPTDSNSIVIAGKEYGGVTTDMLGAAIAALKNSIDTLNYNCIVPEENDSLSQILTETNTIYIINYAFNITNTTLTIPANCKLFFTNGSISGGTVVLDNTEILGNVNFNGTTIYGSCTNEILTPQMFGAYPSLAENENNKTQHLLAFQNMLDVFHNANTKTSTIYIPSGHYAINKNLYVTKPFNIYGDGVSSVLDIYEGYCLYLGRDASGEFNNCCQILDCYLTEDATKYDTKLTLNDVSSINVNDYLILVDSQDGSFNSSRTYFRNGEIVKVSSVDSTNNIVYISARLFDTYPSAFGSDYSTTLSNVTHRTIITKYTPIKVNFSNLTIYSHSHSKSIPPTAQTLSVTGIYDSVINNINVINYGNATAASVGLSLNFKVCDSQIRSYAIFNTDCYGLVTRNAQNFMIDNVLCRSIGGHSIAAGGANNKYCIVNRCFTYQRIQIESRKNESGGPIIDIDVHANAEYHKYLNIQAPHVTCDLGGFNITIADCNLYTVSTSFTGGDFTLSKCRLNSLYSSEALISNLTNETKPSHISITDCVIRYALKYNYQIAVENQSTTKAYDSFIFRNNICEGLKMRLGSIDNIIIENNIFNNEGIYITQCRLNTISIQNNIMKEGYIYILNTTNNCMGTIQSNQITQGLRIHPLVGDDISSTIFLHKFEGFLLSNVIYRTMDISNNSYRIAVDTRKSNITLLNNTFNTIAEYDWIARSADNSTVICRNNTRKRMESGMAGYVICKLSENCTAIDDDYYDVPTDLRPFGNSNFLGTVLYFENKNRLGYVASKAAEQLLKIQISSTNYYLGENIFEASKAYFVTASGSGKHNIYFSKYNDPTDPNFESGLVTVIKELGYKNKIFRGTDLTEYPYLYVTTSVSTTIVITFSENTYICDYDSAAYGVRRYGTTANRPNKEKLYNGFMYLDTTLGKPIWAITTGTNILWKDATGATV